MSWLTDLTSKAESLLTKLDQSAATSLQNDSTVEEDSPQQRIGEISINKPAVETSYEPPMVTTKASYIPPPMVNRSANDNNFKEVKPTKSINAVEQSNLMRSSSTPSLKKQDDMLFEFLNSNNPPPQKGHIRNLSGPKTSTPRRPSNLTNGASSSMETLNNIDTTDAKPKANTSQSKNDKIHVDTPTEIMAPVEINNHRTESVTSDNKSVENTVINIEDKTLVDKKILDSHVSNLELENKLLKNEMHSLNEEMASTLKKMKEYKEESEKFKQRYENRRNQQNEDYERVRAEFENKEADTTEALKAKDSQLAVLRVRIHDVDTQLEQRTKLLEEVQAQNDLIMKDHTDASGVQNVALDNLRNKLQESEMKLKQEQEQNTKLKADLMDIESRFVSEKLQYTQSIQQLQVKQHEGKDKYREYEQKLKSSEDTSQSVQKELHDYKEKAARILQAKEKLIMSLRQGTGAVDMPHMLMSELEEVKQEKNMLYDDLNKTKYELDQIKTDFADLELVHNNESEESNERIENLQHALENEQVKRKHAEEDMKRYMQELQFTRDDLHKSKKNFVAQNQQNESEIKRLQNQISLKHTSSSSQDELENRIRTLTDSLIQKQTVVEALSTEKNSLVLQLERLEKQYLDVQNSLTRRKKDIINIDDPEDPESASRLQPMASIMPKQITQNTRWKKTVNDLDKFSVRLGVFLRRYPIARLMVIGYMVLLHLWSTFVLLTYTPEVHDDHNCNPK